MQSICQALRAELAVSGSRDPNYFYFRDARPRVAVEALNPTCEAAPHQSDPTVLNFRAVVPAGGVGDAPRLRVRVQASNLRRLIEKFPRFSICFQRGNFLGQVKVSDEQSEGSR